MIGYKFIGTQARDLAGISVSSAGDIDGDGNAVLIIGAFRADGGGVDSGEAYLLTAANLAAADARDGSADGMIIDGPVINASAMVIGTNIDLAPMAELEDSFTLYHIETENHDVILANGATTGTFVDYIGRQAFDNYPEYLDLYGAERVIAEMPAPRISTHRLVPEVVL